VEAAVSDKEPRAKQLAMILQGIDDLKMERAEYLTDYKERLTHLVNEASKLKRDIISGQMTIVDAIESHLPEINAELQKNAPPGTKVTLAAKH
jgi:hypothetical protein